METINDHQAQWMLSASKIISDFRRVRAAVTDTFSARPQYYPSRANIYQTQAALCQIAGYLGKAFAY